MSSIYKVKVGKQGRIVLPKNLREAYGVNTGNEAIIIARDGELTIHFHKLSENPIQDLIELSKTTTIGLSAEELKKKADQERIKHFLRT
jgi:AbrB family looped-hinge helix DNA binding protein